MTTEESRRMASALIRLVPTFSRMVMRPLSGCPLCSLTPGQLQALLCIQQSPGHNMTHLSSTLQVSRQQLTRTVDALVEQGLVERYEKEGNRRVILLRPTAQAAALRDELTDTLAFHLHQAMQGLSADQKRALADACAKIDEIFSRQLSADSEDGDT